MYILLGLASLDIYKWDRDAGHAPNNEACKTAAGSLRLECERLPAAVSLALRSCAESGKRREHCLAPRPILNRTEFS